MRDWKRFRSFLRYTEIQENKSIFEVLLTSREFWAILLSILRQGLLLIPLLFILNALGGLNGVIYGQTLTDYIAVFLSVVLWHKCKTYNSARKS